MADFFDDLAEALGGGKLRTEGDVVHAIVRSGDSWFAVRSRTAPFAEVFVMARPLDGFELTIKWGDRLLDPDVGDPVFDAAFGLATNDEPLMRAYLDEASRRAMFDSVYEFVDYFQQDLAVGTPPMAKRTWTYELRKDEVVATKGSPENDAGRLARAIHTACALAARAQRWAAEYAALKLDAIIAPEVQLGGEPVLTATRRSVDLELHVLRRRAPDEAGRLRTRISARRINLGGDTLSLLRDGLPRAARPALPKGKVASCELAGYELRRSSSQGRAIDEATQKLVALARPDALIVAPERVELWFDGAVMERERLDTGLELVARWAVDGVEPSGPYR